MKRLDVRSFAEICLSTAKGHDVKPLIDRHLTAGVPKKTFLDFAVNHRVVPLLAASFFDAGIAQEGEIPQPALFRSRQMLMRAQLVHLDAALHERGTRVTLLKGSIQLFRPAYPRPGMRDMADIDMLLDDAAALEAFADLGYGPTPQDEMPVSLTPEPGEHHLAPLSRPRDIAPVEPHVLPALHEYAHLIGNLVQRAGPAPGMKALLLPDPVDQLLLAIVHTLFHDRNSMHGGLFLKSLVDCELLYDVLPPKRRQEAQHLLETRGGGSLWATWRAFSDWCFRHDERALKRNWRAMLLAREFELRSASKAGALSAALANLGIDLLKPRFWRSGRSRYFTQKLFDGSFWKRLRSRFKSALKY